MKTYWSWSTDDQGKRTWIATVGINLTHWMVGAYWHRRLRAFEVALGPFVVDIEWGFAKQE